MNINFFEWLRDGVRQSVLLGVSDAVEQIGMPEHDRDTQPTLASLLGHDTKGKSKRKSNGGNSRKRLGKSLKDMDDNGKAS